MNLTSIVAIYLLFWVMTAFVVLPYGIKNHDELKVERLPGQDHGAPANFNPKAMLLRTTLMSTVLFALYYLNYVYGWIDRNSFAGLYGGTN